MPLATKIKTLLKPKLRTDPAVDNALAMLKVDDGLYRAAFPGYASNFTRDSLTYVMLAGDENGLRAQLAYSAKHQGRKRDPESGEEPGKIHHELPGVPLRGMLTTYNACDTAALFILGVERLYKIDKDEAHALFENVAAAASYILHHTGDDGLFYESPHYAGAKQFGVKVTYWKDSVLNADRDEPNRPIVYSLAHFQNAAGLRAAGKLLKQHSCVAFAKEMYRAGFEKLWNGDHFVVARYEDGETIDPPSTDSLHSLLFIRPQDIPGEYPELIEDSMGELITKVGYRCGLPMTNNMNDYHTGFVWTHEQALLHAAAMRHKLPHAASIAARVFDQLKQYSFPELLRASDYSPAGNAPQLWAIGAYKYFQDPASSFVHYSHL